MGLSASTLPFAMSEDKSITKDQSKGIELEEARSQGVIPEIISVLPLRSSVLFPGSIIPIDVGRCKSVLLIENAIANESPIIGVFAQKDTQVENPNDTDLYDVGCAAKILKVIKLAKDNFSVILQGVSRITLDVFESDEPFMEARVSPVVVASESNVELDALAMNLRDVAKKIVKLMPELPKEAGTLVDSMTESGHLADLITSNLDIDVTEKQDILETFDLKERMKKVLNLLSRQHEVLKVRDRINVQVQEEMGRNQREYVLRQQLKVIQEELGELDDGVGELEEFCEKIEEVQMSDEAKKMALRQYDRLKNMQPSSAEYTVTRTYLEWLVELPWAVSTKDKIDLEEVRNVLDEDHYALDKVKKRIVEYMAVRKLKPDKKGPILCLTGPPGVGKTSLGRSIARSLGREFVRISLGGVRDEAEIRGHRRTYVGSLPGRIIQGMKKAGTNNPVFVLDEIDKLGSDFRGDPSSALLEVLDPEQNHEFSDHYLEVPFDLSKIMFITTANQLDLIPWALRDRLEIIELSGYAFDEKFQIARKYIIPKQIEEHGFDSGKVDFEDDGLRAVIESYTREAGVRNLYREIGTICRAVAVKVVGGKRFKQKSIDAKAVAEFLGPIRFVSEIADRTSVCGVATGMAWTVVGGDILFIEATSMPGSGKLTLTGQLGDVMKESAMAALSYIRSHAEYFGLGKSDLLAKTDVHIHVPSGGVPKDGPSAGITMFVSMLSLFTGKCVSPDISMTGEITLRGNVLQVGGVKEKILAAHRAGIKRVILPEQNMKDLIDIPDQVKKDLKIMGVKHVDELLSLTLVEKKTKAKGTPSKPTKAKPRSKTTSKRKTSISSTVN